MYSKFRKKNVSNPYTKIRYGLINVLIWNFIMYILHLYFILYCKIVRKAALQLKVWGSSA